MQDHIQKDQLNFVYQTLNIIHQSPATEKLLKREDSIMKTTIPFLIMFKVLNINLDHLKNAINFRLKIRRLNLERKI